MIKCCKCKEDKIEEAFPWKNKTRGIKQPYCKSCKSEYNKKWYSNKENKEKHLATVRLNNKRYAERNKEFVYALKDVPCADCGERHNPWVMQFDHLGEDKDHDISRMMCEGHAIESIKREIAKCEVVCANCHAERTYKRRLI